MNYQNVYTPDGEGYKQVSLDTTRLVRGGQLTHIRIGEEYVFVQPLINPEDRTDLIYRPVPRSSLADLI